MAGYYFAGRLVSAGREGTGWPELTGPLQSICTQQAERNFDWDSNRDRIAVFPCWFKPPILNCLDGFRRQAKSRLYLCVEGCTIWPDDDR